MAVRIGSEARQVKSVRVMPKKFKDIVKEYGSLQKFLDYKIKYDTRLPKDKKCKK